MDKNDQQSADFLTAITELSDSLNRLSAVMERNRQATLWNTAMMQWCAEPWWRRGPAPKWPGRD